MKQIILFSITALLFSGCLDEEFTTLDQSVFEAEDIFRLISVERDTTSAVRADITLDFTTVYDEATQAQKNKVMGILVVGPRTEMSQIIAPDATNFVMRDVRFDWQQCVRLWFVTTDRQLYSQEVELCVNP